jgi:hypothetical protein
MVFGNGIGFVWHAWSLQQEQVLHGAVVHAVEAGFVAVEQGEAVGIVGALEGGSHEAGSVAGIRDVEALVQQVGFDGPGAAHAPPGGAHFFDEAELDAIGWLEAGEVVGHDLLEAFGIFVLEEYDAGEQGVAARVLGRDVFTGLRGRAVGACAVGAGGLDSSYG